MPIALLLLALTVQAQDFSARWEMIRQQATPAQLYSFLQAMPKGGDLHHHASLSFYATDVLTAVPKLAHLGYRYHTRTSVHYCPDNENGPFLLYQNLHQAQHAKLSDCRKKDFTPIDQLTQAQREAWLSAHILDEAGENRNEFFEEIVLRLTPLSRNPHLFAELFALNLKRFSAEGVRYIEAQWNPFLAEKPDGAQYTPKETIAIVQTRLNQPDVTALPIHYKFQLTVIRFRADIDQQILNLYEFATKHRNLFVGINAAGREDNDKGHALRMLTAFREARRRFGSLPMSIHAGEKDSPGPEVRKSLLLGANRIGHGVNLIDDPETMLLLRNGKNLVEINLVSNRVLDYTPDLSKHPFPEYFRFGIPVCLNTDDRGSWDSNMTDEYMHAVQLFRLNWDELKQLARNSIQYSFAPFELKQQLSNSYEQAIQQFEGKMNQESWASVLNTAKDISGYARRTFFH